VSAVTRRIGRTVVWLPNDFDEIRQMFSKRHAYRIFRKLLLLRSALDRWHEFESRRRKSAAGPLRTELDRSGRL